MRRAKKEGRFMEKAPIAYMNRTDEWGRQYIAPKKPQADILRWSFNKIAEGVFNTEQIYKMAKQKGLAAQKVCFGLPCEILCTAVKYLFQNTKMKKAIL